MENEGDGTLLLQGWRIWPAAYLTADDSVPVRQARGAASGGDPSGDNATQIAVSDIMGTPQEQP